MKEKIKRVIIEFDKEEEKGKINDNKELFEDEVSELLLTISNNKNEEENISLELFREELTPIKDKISMVERFIDTNYPEFLVDGFKNYFDTLVDEQRALEQLIKEIELYFSIPF